MDDIIEACSRGDADYLSSREFDPNLRDEGGNYLLHIAASQGHQAVVKLLLSRQANVNSTSEYQRWTPIIAALNGQHNTIAWLLLHQPGIDLIHSDNDVICWFISHQQLILVEYCYQSQLLHFTSPAHKEVVLNRHLLLAIKHLEYSAIDYLLTLTSDVSLTHDFVTRRKLLIYFCYCNDMRQGPQARKTLKHLTELTTDLNVTDIFGNTALDFLMRNKLYLLIKLLFVTAHDCNKTVNIESNSVSNGTLGRAITKSLSVATTIDKWRKEIDAEVGIAADLYVLCVYRQVTVPDDNCNANLVRLIAIIDKLKQINDDMTQLLLLRLCGVTDRDYIPTLYIELAKSSLLQ